MSSRTFPAFSVGFALLLAIPLSAADPPRVTPEKLPSWFPATLFSPEQVVAENYDQGSFFVRNPTPRDPDNYDRIEVRGRFWSANLPPKDRNDWKTRGLAPWKAAEAQLAAAGFRNVYRKEYDRHVDATYRKGEGAAAAYLAVTLDADDVSRNKMRAVEVAPPALAVDAKPPAAEPEKVTDRESFPYLPPPPGAKLGRTLHDDDPMRFFPAGSDSAVLVGSGRIEKDYDDDPAISQLEFHDAYAAALKKAGWTVTHDADIQGFLYAHYDRNGRDIYVHLSHTQGQAFVFNVADVGADLAARLRKDCKAALYGVNFDFDKATLRPDSDPVLGQVLKLLKDDPKLALEIGGHTDNVGKPDYNIGLSDRRAAAVKQWLVAHGIADARLTTRGYGDTQPLVPNTSDENRAKNRRVELKKPGCR